jgi:ABC-2 type transport system ATP-binding protein
MISVTNVTKRYGEVHAVRDISFTVDRGEVIGLVGPNGAGKTTTMKMITGYIVPTDGKIEVDGVDVVRDPHRVQAQVGYLPEHAPLYPEMPVQDYLIFMGKMRGLRGTKVTERLGFVADACGIRPMLTRLIKHLSKGYRQRVGIAQSIIHDPAILILDEPTSGLDPNQIIEIRELIRQLGKNKTVILSTHILSEVEETCSRAIIIAGGRKAADDKIENLAGGRSVRVALESTADPKSKLEALAGVASVESLAPRNGVRVYRLTPEPDQEIQKSVFDLAVRERWQLTELHVERKSLEDVFREVSQKGAPSA